MRALSLRYSAPFVEQVKGVEPSSSAWKADVLAVVRHLRDTIYYTHRRPGLSSPCCGKTACKIAVWFLRGPELGKN